MGRSNNLKILDVHYNYVLEKNFPKPGNVFLKKGTNPVFGNQVCPSS